MAPMGTYFVDDARAAINWGAAVVNGKALVDIWKLTAVAGKRDERWALWAGDGTEVTAGQVAAAQAATTGGAIPATVLPGKAVGQRGGGVDHKTLARTPEAIMVGAVTRNGNGAITTAAVVWPDGAPGTYASTTLSSAFPGAVDAYTITYGNPVTKTYTQPPITRDATSGAPTAIPAITVT